MRKILLTLSASALLLSSATFAATLDKDTIKAIHDKVKSTFVEKCKSDVPDATDDSCECLADKAQNYLDDAALAKCANDESGGPCITQAVSDAATKATSKENLKMCIKLKTKPADTTKPAATTSTTPAPAPAPAIPTATPAAPAPTPAAQPAPATGGTDAPNADSDGGTDQ